MFTFKTSRQDYKRLNQAYCDLILLLDRNYPKKSALTFVSNHYTLDSKFRNILNRAALPINTVKTIQNNLLENFDSLKDRNFHIDAYNQIITFFSIVNLDPVIICRDGLLRDIFSSLHSKRDLRIDRELISPYFRALLKLEPKNIFFYFDKQISFSKNHARLFSILMQEFEITGSCDIHKAVDWSLKKQSKDVVFSHDTAILTIAPYCFDFLSWFLNSNLSHKISQQRYIDFLNITCF
ncbi:MAG: DUF434 domain-containing protein [Candidatus Heimdallarchaeota archaeon]|nr:MAG: DUF434 domain-containing protein [Candidatus Heimdallarchaeota archaeon]